MGVSISMIIVAIISPVLGAISDYSAGKKRFLLFFTSLCIIATASLYFLGEGDLFYAIVLFIIANIGFEAGLVFYDAFLPEITTPKNYGRVSGYGFAMGYLGSLASLMIVYPFIEAEMIKETFPISAAFFLVFAAPLFIFLQDSRKKVERTETYFTIGFKRVYYTLSHLKVYKNLALFLLAFFFYIEGVNTVIFFSAIFAKKTLGFSDLNLIIFFMIVQSTAIIGSILFGIISDSIGQKRSITISLVIWILTMGIAFFTSSSETVAAEFFTSWLDITGENFKFYSFYVVGLLAGGVMGATQSTSRGLMSTLTPPDKKTEFFGFYSFFGKSSAVLGPLVFGAVSYLLASQRLAILTNSIFFIVGIIILQFVKDKR
jgi:UMF1 family MFS transporter